MEPPNGERVTNARLYMELFEFDQRLGERFTAYQDEIVCLHDQLNQAQAALTEHNKGHHSINARISSFYGVVAVVVSTVVSAVIAAVRNS